MNIGLGESTGVLRIAKEFYRYRVVVEYRHLSTVAESFPFAIQGRLEGVAAEEQFVPMALREHPIPTWVIQT